MIEKLRPSVLGWKGDFWLAQTNPILRELGEWMRHRMLAIHLKQWKRGSTIHRELLNLGANPAVAQRVAANSRRRWRNGGLALNSVRTIADVDRPGIPRLT